MGNLHSLMDSDTEPNTTMEYNANQRALQTAEISDVELPTYIALWRHNQPVQKNKFTACILKTEKVNNPTVNKKVWKFHIINNPLEYHDGVLKSGVLTYSKFNDSWFNSQKHKILVKKNDEVTNTDILYNNAFIMFEDSGIDPIPVCKIKNKHGILQSEFFHLDTSALSYGFTMMYGSPFRNFSNNMSSTTNISSDQQINLRREAMFFAERAAEEFLQGLPRPPTPPRRSPRPPTPPRISRTITVAPSPPLMLPNTTSSGIPQHIVNQYIEGLVAKNEACPITMIELQKYTTCITPCGHAMTHSSAKHWIQGAHSCPVCRLPVSENQLQVWRL